MSYTAEDVKRLREVTAAGMLDCKKALDETGGDFDKAIEVIRVKGLKGVTKREGRSTSNGLIAAKAAGTTAVMLELNCETDFVAKGDRFQAVAEELVSHLFNTKQGELAAFVASNLPDGKSVQVAIDEANATLGEKVELRRVAKVVGDKFSVYLHRTSKDLPPQVGVVVAYTGSDDETARAIAQHISFADPQYLTKEDVPQSEVDNERRIVEEISRGEGKPEAALPKIVEGRLGAFFKQVALLEQDYARDNKLTVQQVADQAGLTVTGFVRFKVGA